MRRRSWTITLAAVAFAMILTSGASAAPLASAHLVEGTSVTPGPDRVFTIRVAATAMWIDAVAIILPTSQAGVRTSATTFDAPDGWTVTRVSAGDAQKYYFWASSRPIGPLRHVDFRFLADVAPTDVDRSGTFSVAVSGDGGETSRPAAPPLADSSATLTTRVCATSCD